MDNLLEELGNREKEINEYLKLLAFIDGTELTRMDGRQFDVNTLLTKTLKGVVFLLLYNLIESTMREAISFIHDSILSNRVTYEDLRLELKKELWKRAKNNNLKTDDLVDGTSGGISANLHQVTYDSKKIFSGNVVRDEIKKLARIYGFSESTEYSKTGGGNQLEQIKENRNDLAHGNKTFSEVGSGNTVADLKSLSDKVIHYIYEIIDNIDYCVEHKKYR